MARRKKGKSKKRPAITRRETTSDGSSGESAPKKGAIKASRAGSVDDDEATEAGADEPAEVQPPTPATSSKRRPRKDEAEAAEAAAASADSDADGGDDDGGDDDGGDGDSDDGGAGGGGSDEPDDEDIPKRGAAWGWPLAKLDRKWTWLETRLLFAALMLLTVLLCLWFAIRGMKEPVTAKEAAGTIFRAVVGMGVLGGVTRFATRRRLDERQRNIATVAAMAVGAIVAPQWRAVGVQFFAGLLDWLQEGSSLTLMGGLKGVSTRLTMTVALLGASLAAATGTHINIDVVVRFIPQRFRRSVNVLGSLAAAAVCIAAAIGFYDFIAVTGMGSPIETCEPAPPDATTKNCRPTTFGEQTLVVQHELSEHWFLWRKQALLDIGALPYVLKGEPWNSESRFTGADWNQFLDEEGFVERYGADKVDPLRATGEDIKLPRLPFVTAPHGRVRGALLDSMDLIFPLGFFMIGLRFVLRALLVMSGFVRLDENQGGGDDEEDDVPDADEGDADEGDADEDELSAEGAA